MTKMFNLKAVAAAAGIAAAVLSAAPAHAYTYALSHLDVSNLSLVTTSGSATVTGYTFNLTNTATLNGNSVISTATCNSSQNPCSGGSPVLDAQPANAPGGAPVRSNNDFSFFGPGGATPYSNSDSVINTAAVVQGVPTSTQQIAESLLVASGTAAASTLVQSNTALTFSVLVGASGANLALSFTADPDLRAAIANTLTGSYLSQADMSAVFTLRSTSGQFVTWAPTGTPGSNDCITTLVGVTCTETADTQNLNTGVSTATNNTDVQSSFDNASIMTAFGINIMGLQAGNYTLTLAAGTSTSIVQQIPEPGTMALVGLALVGLGFTGKRSRQLLSRKS